jgi:hypothetical protein
MTAPDPHPNPFESNSDSQPGPGPGSDPTVPPSAYAPQPGWAAPPPPYAYTPYGYGYAGTGWADPDPLVPHPAGGVADWWRQVWLAFARSWRPLALIVVITNAAPVVALALLGSWWVGRSFSLVDSADGVGQDVIIHWGVVGTFAAIAGIIALVSVFLYAISWCAGMWTVTRQAAGLPASVGRALAFGARHCLRTGGVLIVVGLMVAIGVVACVVPGLYLGVAASLVVPFLVFDRGVGAISGSFQVVNRNFGAVLGRLLIVYLIAAIPSVVVSTITLGLRSATLDSSPAASVVPAVLDGVVAVPIAMFTIVGVMLIYAQMWARAIPTTVHDLARSLDS